MMVNGKMIKREGKGLFFYNNDDIYDSKWKEDKKRRKRDN